MKSLLSLILGLLLLNTASAEDTKKLYKWTDENGNVHYSDEPHEGADEIEMKEVPAIKMVPPKVKPIELDEYDNNRRGDADDLRGPGRPYSQLLLSEPAPDAVVRNNASSVTLLATLEPGLLDGHKVQFYLDGKAVSKIQTALSVTISDVEYGPHSARFVVLDDKNREIQSSKGNSFQLLHVINPNRRNNR